MKKILAHYPANIDLFKANNRNTRQRCKICLELTIKTPARRYWRHSGMFIVNFDHISHFFSSVSVVDFEQINVSLVTNNVSIIYHPGSKSVDDEVYWRLFLFENISEVNLGTIITSAWHQSNW